MKLSIEKTDNGYLMEYDSEYADGAPRVSKRVFQENDDDGELAEVNAMACALRTIDELIGPSTSRYSPGRVYVKVEPGDKHVSEEEESEEEENTMAVAAQSSSGVDF